MGIAAAIRRCVLFGLLAGAMMSGANEARAAWVTYQADAAHSGHVPGSYRFRHARRWWRTTVAPNAPNGLAVGDGAVFVSVPFPFGVPYPPPPSIHALDQVTGSPLWSASFETTTISPPAYFNGAVYFQIDGSDPDNFLKAYTTHTGSLLFSAPYDAQFETYLNPTPFGENIYVGGGYYGGMYSFNASNGTRNWFGGVPQYDGWTPSIDGRYAYAYTGMDDNYPSQGVFVMNNVCDGTLAAIVFDPIYQWRGYTMNSAVALGTAHDAFTINGGRVVSWDTTLDADHTPNIRWSLTGGFSGQPSLANGMLYVIANGGLSVLDETTGSTIWTWMPPSDSLIDRMVVTDNLVFATTATRTFAIDQVTQKAVWSRPVSGVLAFSNNRLYVAGSDGVVSAFGRGRMLTDVSPMTTTTITMCPTTTTTTTSTTTTTQPCTCAAVFPLCGTVSACGQTLDCGCPGTVTTCGGGGIPGVCGCTSEACTASRAADSAECDVLFDPTAAPITDQAQCGTCGCTGDPFEFITCTSIVGTCLHSLGNGNPPPGNCNTFCHDEVDYSSAQCAADCPVCYYQPSYCP